MEMHQLRYFVAVARTGTFSRAAAECRVAQPSLSQQIQKLESEVGDRLFERTRRRAIFTPAGARFAEAHNNLGYTLRKQGAANYEKSLEYYNTAIGLNPKLAEAYMYRGVLYIEMGRKSDAEADLAALQRLSPRLAKELAEVIKTGKEEDRFYGLASKISG
jgi:tetratricopeptide (TPR) repeat protein